MAKIPDQANGQAEKGRYGNIMKKIFTNQTKLTFRKEYSHGTK